MTWTCQKEERGISASSGQEDEVDVQMCPCGKAVEARIHIVGQCDMYKEERVVLKEEMREIDECDLEEFGTLDSSDKPIAILGDRWRPQAAKQEGDKIRKAFLCVYGNNVMGAQLLEVSLSGVGASPRLERDAWSMVK